LLPHSTLFWQIKLLKVLDPLTQNPYVRDCRLGLIFLELVTVFESQFMDAIRIGFKEEPLLLVVRHMPLFNGPSSTILEALPPLFIRHFLFLLFIVEPIDSHQLVKVQGFFRQFVVNLSL
jgi:hypothetical protein